MATKAYTIADKFIMGVDQALVTVFGNSHLSERAYPASGKSDERLGESDKQAAAHLMRTNHVGEVCTQGLYQSQAITARSKTVKTKMLQAAVQDTEHMDWCNRRLDELGGRRSLLSPLCYMSSFAVGAITGIAGDRWNLGLISVAEKHSVHRLDSQLSHLSPNDERSRAIVGQMKIDNEEHASSALSAGGNTLPAPIQHGVKLSSKIMNKAAHWI